MIKISAVYKIIRPVNAAITFLTIIVAAVICSPGSFPIVKIILAAISGALSAAAGNVVNDIFDYEIDKINRPDRPLPSGKISLNQAVALYSFLIFISLLISSFINPTAVIINFAALLLLFFYSFKFKKIVLFGNFTVAMLTGLAFIYGGVAAGSIKNAVIPSLFALLINFIREIIKDMEDVEGDSKIGVISFPNKFGFQNSKKIIFTFSAVLIASTFFPFIYGIYNLIYFLIILLLVDPILIFAVISLFKDDTKKNLNKISLILKLNMVFGLTAIYFGR